MDDRFVAEGEYSRSKVFSLLKREGEVGSRVCQKLRGEELPKGDASNGEESRVTIIFWRGLSHAHVGNANEGACVTFVACLKEGEFLRMPIGLTSDSGIGPLLLDLDCPAMFLLTRSGDTCQ